ncbi:hypothetical protein BDW02DRAFT_569208 [Decorospora gaudefroyi]|uniref:Uncharacterized protein n=1 Tax=Decorospora gaudefroyi TaxID=184978 RepID=A0A6A5KE17_9PLEO|nr:hypothetical protein BDW02DRAFT_569208 [Decorospora gaudefroyi]
MLVTGIILIPTAIATTPTAVQDLVDMRNVINAAASAIGDPNNPNRGFGFNLLGGSGAMGTADLVNNVTTTILRSKFQLNTNRTTWLLPPGDIANTSIPINDTAPGQPLATPTLPITTSLTLPSVLPTTTPTLNNVTIDLTTAYIDYVSAIPNLATSLRSLGTSYHREMNAPVREAIAQLSQGLSAFQSTMLLNQLIERLAVLRTIRASRSLESAQAAWNRFLNLPGAGSGSADDGADADADATLDTSPIEPMFKRSAIKRPPPKYGKYYTHQELWGKREPEAEQSEPGKASHVDVVVQLEEQRMKTAEEARVGRPFAV